MHFPINLLPLLFQGAMPSLIFASIRLQFTEKFNFGSTHKQQWDYCDQKL